MTDAARLVLGTAQLGQPYGIANSTGPPSRSDAIAMVRAAADAGVGAIDCAPVYGTAEDLVVGAGVTVPVFTKLSPDADPVHSVDESCRRLRRDVLDILFLHDPAVVERDPANLVGRAYDLVGRKVRSLGASVYTPKQFSAALADRRISAIQAPVSAADRRVLDGQLLEDAAHHGTPVYARSVYLQGALLLDPDRLAPHLRSLGEVIAAVDAIARRRGMTRAAVLATYVRDLPGVTGVILGAETIEQLGANLIAISAPALDETDRAAIEGSTPPDGDALDPRTWPAVR